MRGLAAICALGGVACGAAHDGDSHAASGSASSVAAFDAAPQIPDPPVRALGAASPEEADYRHGGGAAAYARAIAAEKQADWPAVVAACREALAADPHHIDAAWLEAAALARQNAFGDMLDPLGVAAAGDWGKWGERSLVMPMFKDFLASPWGAAWQRAAPRYRDAYAQALSRALPVIARRAGAQPKDPGPADLFAYDPIDHRWLRLTRTGGAVVALVDAPGSPFSAYVSFRDVRAGHGVVRHWRVGAVDRATGRAGRELELDDVATLAVAWRVTRTGEPGLEIETSAPHGAGVPLDWRVDWRRGTKTKIKGPIPVHGATVTAHGARRRRLPIADVTADWDDDGTASAFRVETSNKTVEPPGAPLVDGNTLAWSPDRARLAFATAPAEPCAVTPGAATVVAVDAATGVLHALGDADDPGQLRWLDADHLAYVTGAAIRVVDVGRGAETARITGGGGLALDGWLARPHCDRGEAAVFAIDPNEPVEPEPDEPESAPTSTDAGVSDAGAPSDGAR